MASIIPTQIMMKQWGNNAHSCFRFVIDSFVRTTIRDRCSATMNGGASNILNYRPRFQLLRFRFRLYFRSNSPPQLQLWVMNGFSLISNSFRQGGRAPDPNGPIATPWTRTEIDVPALSTVDACRTIIVSRALQIRYSPSLHTLHIRSNSNQNIKWQSHFTSASIPD